MSRARRTSAADALPPTARRARGERSERAAALETRLLSVRRSARARRSSLSASLAALVAAIAALMGSLGAVAGPVGPTVARLVRRGLPRAADELATAAKASVLVADAASEALLGAQAAARRRAASARASLIPAFGPQASAAALLGVATVVLTAGGVAAASLVPTAGQLRPRADVVAAPPVVPRAERPSAQADQAPATQEPTTIARVGEARPVVVETEVEAAAAAEPVEVVLEPVLPTDRGALPLGKGMWLWLPDRVEGGDVSALVAKSQQIGLTHLYVRTGSSRGGFYAGPYLDALLPQAHAAGIRVYGWDFPYLEDVGADVARAAAAISHTTPGGHRIDGFAADIETPSEGTHLTVEAVTAYGAGLRAAVGTAYPLIAVVPRPSPLMLKRFPYTEATAAYDAIAPMTYWLNRQPDTDVVNDVTVLAPLGKPVIPIGQAYDGAPEGGRPGPPPPDEITRFLAAAEATGAVGASFWSWQHASQEIFDTIAAAQEFRWVAGPPDQLRPGQIRALQVQLTALGHPVAVTGAWDPTTTAALSAYQQRARLAVTGELDEATVAFLLAPFAPPISPAG